MENQFKKDRASAGRRKTWIKSITVFWALFMSFWPNLSRAQIYSPSYTFVTLAGQAGTASWKDGQGTSAWFNYPNGIARDNAGNLYVADFHNSMIREISPSGRVSTIIQNLPSISLGVAVDNATNLYITSFGTSTIYKAAQVAGSWVMTIVAGRSGSLGTNDGIGTNALFFGPNGIAIDSVGNLYVADEVNNLIRKITPAGTNWVVSTVAGLGQTSAGSADGTNSDARFYSPTGLAVDGAGNIYVADNGNALIRKITPEGTNWVTTTIAGTALVTGFADGTNHAALFNQPNAIAIDSATNLYVTDQNNDTIRKLTLTGTNWVATTLAGLPQKTGTNDGTGSVVRFNQEAVPVVDAESNLYVTDTQNDTIRVGYAPSSVGLIFSTNNGVITLTGFAGSPVNVMVPAFVTDISPSAFQACSNLISLAIPASVTNIGDSAFSGCTNLKSVYFSGATPVADCSAFLNDPATIYYLQGAAGWGSSFACLPAVMWNPPIQGSFGIQSNQFGFNVTGPTNIAVTVQVSTNLISGAWTNIQLSSLTNGSVHVTDPAWTNYSSRFYRVAYPPIP